MNQRGRMPGEHTVARACVMMARIGGNGKGPPRAPARRRAAGLHAWLRFPQVRQRHVECEVVLAVGIKDASRVFDQNRRAASDPLDASICGTPSSSNLT